MKPSSISGVPRPAQIRASTLFVITLVILAVLVAGSIFHTVVWPWMSKTTPLAVQPPPPGTPLIPLTIANSNILDKTVVQPVQVKTINVTTEVYEQRVKEARDNLDKNLPPDTKRRDTTGVPLTSNQIVGRITVVPIRADEPVFEDQFEPLHYPKPIKPAEGMESVIIEVPAKYTMVQIGDYVDVICTMGSDNPNTGFGPGQSSTATIAHSAKVLARFGSTSTAKQPPPGDKRTFTLEVTPYRVKLIELAKNLGATFSLNVVLPKPDMNDPAEENRKFVNSTDLVKLFGIEPPRPGPQPWVIEHFSGNQQRGTTLYDYPKKRAPGSDTKPKPPPPPRPGIVANPQPEDSVDTEVADSGAANVNWGFRNPGVAPSKGCPTCGQKK